MKRRPVHSSRTKTFGLFDLRSKKRPGFCPVKFCHNVSAGRLHDGGSCLCAKHKMQLWRARNPARASYARLRHSAAKRRIVFALTFEQFIDICAEYNFSFTQRASEFRLYPSFDRIDARLGYIPGNVQVLTVSQNAVKSRRQDRALARYYGEPFYGRTIATMTDEDFPLPTGDDLPF